MVTLLKEIDPSEYNNFIYIYSRRKIHVCRIQEGYICHSRGITTILGETPKTLEKWATRRTNIICVLSFFLSLGLATEVPKRTHYGIV